MATPWQTIRRFCPTRSTLYKWVEGLESNGVALSGGAKRGRKNKLPEEQERIVVGFVKRLSVHRWL